MMRRLLRAGLFLIPVLILLPHLAEFPFQPGAAFSDLVVSHYPNGLFLQRALLAWKTVPLWSPAILSGYPFGANPLSGLYYPPGWLALLFPLPFGFQLVIVVHLIWGGIGLFRLLRLEGLSERAALLGALAFEALPKLFSHLSIGHITLIYAVAWTPWLLVAERRAVARPERRFFLPGVVLGIIVLADVRWAAYAGLLWLAYSLVLRLGSAGREKPLSGAISIPALKQLLASSLRSVLIAGLIAAPVLLPLVEYTRLTTREQLTAGESLVLSMPPGQLFGLIYPNIGRAPEWMLYPGAVIASLVIYALTRSPARRRASFWLVILLASLIFSLGSYLPPLEALTRLPGMDLLRVPPRVLFISGLCTAIVAAIGLDDLLDRIQQPTPPARDNSGLILFAITAFVVLFAAAVCFVVKKDLERFQFAWGAVFFLIGAAAILLARARRIPAAGLFVMVVSLSLVDLSAVNAFSLDFRSPGAVFSVGQEAAAYIRGRGDLTPFRTYSPSYSLPQHTAEVYGLELADGVDPLQLAAYVRFMEPAAGVPASGYSVTLPQFASGDPATANQAYPPDAALLGVLNVKYMVAAFPLQSKDLVLLAQFGQTRVYQNQRCLPRAWVQAANAPPGQQILSEPQVVTGPDSLVLHASGPGLLVLSELAYPGWQVTIDGRPAPVETVGGLLRGARLSSGQHEVRFIFRPWTVYAGLALASVTWVVLIAFGVSRKRISQFPIGENPPHG